jgi:hypothetical protein
MRTIALPSRIVKLIVRHYTSNSMTDECMTVFLAQGLDRDHVGGTADAGEGTVVRQRTLEQLSGMVRDGQIKDGPTIVCLQHLRDYLSSH